jgi:5-methylcytosine-specific restriction protein A
LQDQALLGAAGFVDALKPYLSRRRLKEVPRAQRPVEAKKYLLRKELRLQQQGELKCDVCDLVFADVYGAHGAGYIEAHHTVPVAELRGVKKTKLSDLALVCANCHRVLHRVKPRMSVDRLRAFVHARRAETTTPNNRLQRQRW